MMIIKHNGEIHISQLLEASLQVPISWADAFE